MTSKESRAVHDWTASIEQSRKQAVADRLASITHWRMIQARNERRDTVAAYLFAAGTIAILAAMLAAAFGVI
jgi:threonine dehydrogenase-like Zn-dependent dehydrogenase